MVSSIGCPGLWTDRDCGYGGACVQLLVVDADLQVGANETGRTLFEECKCKEGWTNGDEFDWRPDSWGGRAMCDHHDGSVRTMFYMVLVISLFNSCLTLLTHGWSILLTRKSRKKAEASSKRNPPSNRNLVREQVKLLSKYLPFYVMSVGLMFFALRRLKLGETASMHNDLFISVLTSIVGMMVDLSIYSYIKMYLVYIERAQSKLEQGEETSASIMHQRLKLVSCFQLISYSLVSFVPLMQLKTRMHFMRTVYFMDGISGLLQVYVWLSYTKPLLADIERYLAQMQNSDPMTRRLKHASKSIALIRKHASIFIISTVLTDFMALAHPAFFRLHRWIWPMRFFGLNLLVFIALYGANRKRMIRRSMKGHTSTVVSSSNLKSSAQSVHGTNVFS